MWTSQSSQLHHSIIFAKSKEVGTGLSRHQVALENRVNVFYEITQIYQKNRITWVFILSYVFSSKKRLMTVVYCNLNS